MMISDEQCRAARALLGWSQEDLAAKSMLPVATIAEFESGQRTPSKEALTEIRLVLSLEGCQLRDGGVIRPRLALRAEQNERKKRKDVNREQSLRLPEMEINELMSLRVALNTELNVLKREQGTVISRIAQISNELRRRKSPGDNVDVSEHAVVRFLERIHHINVKEIRRKIREAIPSNAVRGDKFVVEGITYVISHNGRVTTLYEESEPSVEV